MTTWFADAEHLAWLDSEGDRLLEFGRAAAVDGGFGWLGDDGAVDASQGVQLWITCRMTHIYALAAMRGWDGARELMDHGVKALLGPLRDQVNDGWYSIVGGNSPAMDIKENYAHAFVILASASATAAGHPDAKALMDHAIAVHTDKFWDADAGMARESYNGDWSVGEDYRGVNSNMHTVEAYLAAADVAQRPDLLERAAAIVDRVVNHFARGNDWLLPEHFSATWDLELDYNVDEPGHPFRPYGVTIGHLLEWSRLALDAEAGLEAAGMPTPDWILPAAKALYGTAVADGWDVDGAEGFVYTMDFERRPVVRERMHWVAAEAIGAAAALWHRTGDRRYADEYAAWWTYAVNHLIDDEKGSWFHELDTANRPSATVWKGKPDLYHAYQATLFPRMPLTPALAPALSQGIEPAAE